ncbi:MAG: hypothetical protein AABY22_27895 [Nanoarchaeota archaeon]
METQILKQCRKCGQDKSILQFRKQSAAKDGLKPYCTPCDDQIAKDRYNANKIQITSKIREWQKKNPKKIKKYRWRWKIKQEIKENNEPKEANLN